MTSERKHLSNMGKCFKLKASFSPCLSIEILLYDLPAIERELTALTTLAPKLFAGSPVVIDLEKTVTTVSLDFDQLKNLLMAQGLIPIGIRGGNQEQQEAAELAGLRVIHTRKSLSSEIIPNKFSLELDSAKLTKLVTTPIRSGITIYAESDLIVTAHVNSGAELVAAGHIHVYGALRGRALAGAYGNKESCIFCKQLNAELVSIAGYYLTKEEMSHIPVSNNMLQIYLENEQLQIKAL